MQLWPYSFSLTLVTHNLSTGTERARGSVGLPREPRVSLSLSLSVSLSLSLPVMAGGVAAAVRARLRTCLMTCLISQNLSTGAVTRNLLTVVIHSLSTGTGRARGRVRLPRELRVSHTLLTDAGRARLITCLPSHNLNS